MGELIIEVKDSANAYKSGYRQTRRNLETGGAEIKRYIKSEKKAVWVEKSVLELKELKAKL